jgi:hypothetical protein
LKSSARVFDKPDVGVFDGVWVFDKRTDPREGWLMQEEKTRRALPFTSGFFKMAADKSTTKLINFFQ